ncbi:YjeF-related protein N-terminus-domain-containing protein [Phaeosphaeriaceae sp. PMI808]|nr:YjeF-related protein N-terminus-domain-containing protein [Phaeosphaeriaceae sp. PMI808]
MAEGGIRARIAALNLEEVHAPAPGVKPTYSYDAVTTKKKPPPPPPSQRPPAYQRQHTVNNPPILSNAPTSARQVGNQPIAAQIPSPGPSPALPPRPPPRNNTTSNNGTPRQTPTLPPRRPSDNRSLRHRESNESISTVASGISTLSLGSRTGTSNGNGTTYQVRAPAYDPSKLPPLPPKRASEEKSATRNAMKGRRDYVPSHSLPPTLPKTPELPARPSLPPRQSNTEDQLPERPALPSRPTLNSGATSRTNRVIAPPPRKSALELGFNKATEPPPVPQNRPSPTPNAASPPPVPLSTRPNLNAIMTSKPKPGALGSCLICRDFSGPDEHATRFPRTQLPSSDVGWLAHQLCSPFPSPTDKARAIFTWLHHNVDYDVHSFFNGTISPTTPEKTITSGLAVCEGYAGLFAALALKAGLQALVCSGDSKGFGHTPLEPGQPVPAFDSNHAWNAVCIDNGEWKLIDPCWGAGHLGCQLKNEGYVRKLNSSQFTMDNNEFGMKHFPSDNAHQFRTDGRVLSFEEFKRDDMGGRVQVMGDCGAEHGVGERTIYPTQLRLKVHDPNAPPVVRFQFSTLCTHWDHEHHGKGKPYVMLLSVAGRDGRNTKYLPFNTDGRTWWLDVERLELGAPGQKISVNAVTEYWRPHLQLLQVGVSQQHTLDIAERCSASMASGLIGIPVAVTLQHPPNTIVQGTVAAVNAQTATLTLQNVFFPQSGQRLNTYQVEGHAIADIKVSVPAPAAAQPPPPPPYSQYPASHVQQASRNPGAPVQHQPPQRPVQHMSQSSQLNQQPTRPPATQPPTFVDPAILSMGKRTSTVTASNQLVTAPPQEAPATPINPVVAARTAPLLKHTSPFIGSAKGRNIRKPSAATLEGPFSSLDIADAEEADSETKTVQPSVRRASINKTRTGKPMDDLSPQKLDDGGKKTRRGGKSRKKELAAQERKNGVDMQSSPDAVRKGKGNGWRNTPILQDPELPTARTPGVIGGRVGLAAAHASKTKTRRQKALDATNGWATEDATDIQDMPEFDFQGNLSKFDKRTVFDQIRNEDTTADEDRLVSFNRIARPGTHGGKNLHPTENILDRKLKSTTNTSSEEDSEIDSSRNSRRAMSRASVKRAPIRQGSGVQADIDLMGSGLLSRANRSLTNRPYASSHATGSPRPGRTATPPDSPISSSTRGCLRLISNDRRCHAITPGSILALEETAEVDYGLTEDMVAENSGRGIAEVALTAINPGGRRLARENPNARPVIVVLAGNHRGGARAVAAARHLQARGPKVMIALLGFERAADWDKDVRRQVDLFRKFGGSVRAWQDTEDALKRRHAPPELIIDALLGRHKEFEALGEQDRRTVLSIVGWANKSRAACLAVETPSGVGGSTGEVAILEGEPLEVRAKYIVCLGAPRSGLLKALQNGAGRDPQWLIWVVDIGVNKPWRDTGISGGKGIKFGEHWVVQVKYSEDDGLVGKA